MRYLQVILLRFFLFWILAALLVGPSFVGHSSLSREFPIYLPYVSLAYQPKNIFGVDGMYALSPGSGFAQMIEANAGWMRPSPPLEWSKVESVEGSYAWENVQTFERNIETIRNKNIEVSAVVLSTPAWAQAIPGVSCGKILPEKLNAFGEFMFQAVKRYSQPPYSIRFWEIWNEPDVDPALVPPTSGFGCWGDQDDEYYGGANYSQMLSVIYPRIKEANPNAYVVVGGLLLDCNPLNPPGGRDCRSSRFFEGILRDGKGRNFDGVALHNYEFYSGELGTYSNLNWNSSWKTTGPSLLAKIQYLKLLLRQYQVGGIFLISTENALLCDLCQNNPNFEETKAIYLVQVYTIALSEGLWGNLWHRVGDWRNSGLMNADLTPRPAYVAFRFMSHTLNNYQFLRKIEEYSGIKGFQFSEGKRRIWILWSRDGEVKSLYLPNPPQKATDLYGSDLPLGNEYVISVYPIFLFFE